MRIKEQGELWRWCWGLKGKKSRRRIQIQNADLRPAHLTSLSSLSLSLLPVSADKSDRGSALSPHTHYENWDSDQRKPCSSAAKQSGRQDTSTAGRPRRGSGLCDKTGTEIQGRNNREEAKTQLALRGERTAFALQKEKYYPKLIFFYYWQPHL